MDDFWLKIQQCEAAEQRVANSINKWCVWQRKGISRSEFLNAKIPQNNPRCRLELHCYKKYSKTGFTHQNTLWLSDARSCDVDIKTWISYEASFAGEASPANVAPLERHPGKVYVDIIWS